MRLENGGDDVGAFLASHREDWIVGTVDDAAARIAEYAAAGVERLYLQHLDFTDDQTLELMARELVPPRGPALASIKKEAHVDPDERGHEVSQDGAAGRQVYDLSLPFNRNMPTYYFYRQVQDAPFFSIVSHPSITPVVDGYVTHVSLRDRTRARTSTRRATSGPTGTRSTRSLPTAGWAKVR